VSVELEARKLSVLPVNIDRLIAAWLSIARVPIQLFRISDGSRQLFSQGTSIRGVSVHRRWSWFRTLIEVRLSVCASPADWQTAYSFLRFALQEGYDVRSDTSDLMGAEALTDEAATLKGPEQFASDVSFFHRFLASSGDQGLDLPVGRFSIPVTLEELPSEPFEEEALAGFRKALQQRAAKYSAARSASILTLKTGATAIVWAGEALLAPEVNHVVLASGGGDCAQYVHVSWERAMRELSGTVERIQQTPARYYFAPIAAHESSWRRLVDAGYPIDQLGQSAG
jgi:hypothetical protein